MEKNFDQLTTSSRKHFLRPSVGIVGGKEAYALLSQKNKFETIRKAVKAML